MVRRRLRGADARAERCLGRDRGRPPRPGGRPHRVRQDPLGVPLVDRPAGDRAGARRRSCAAGCSTSPRSRRSRSTSSATCGRRWSASGRPPTGSAWRCPRSGSACGPATPRPQERRRIQTTPPDILITTPESLFLMLTSQAREALRGVETVIVDEVHAVAGTKRGAHLALSLERLDELLDRPAQRIGLSATVRPVDEVARFLGGSAPVEVVAPASREGVGPQGRRPGRGHDRARRGGDDGPQPGRCGRTSSSACST